MIFVNVIFNINSIIIIYWLEKARTYLDKKNPTWSDFIFSNFDIKNNNSSNHFPDHLTYIGCLFSYK